MRTRITFSSGAPSESLGFLSKMDDLRNRHRQEQKDLQSRITQKKKQATKKTRKGVNDECANLERSLKERQASDIAMASLTNVSEQDNPSIRMGEAVDRVEQEDTSQGTLDIEQPIASVSPSSTRITDGHTKKPNRQKARLARRAANQEAAIEQAEEEAADLPDLRTAERESMREAYSSRGLVEFDIRSDGHCLYAAVADQLLDANVGLQARTEAGFADMELSSLKGYQITRQVAAAFISQNHDDFAPFLGEALYDYVKKIRDTGEWGGHLEIFALARAYGVNINVLQGDGKVEKIQSANGNEARSLWLAYYRHSHGLGEHYNSLRRAS